MLPLENQLSRTRCPACESEKTDAIFNRQAWARQFAAGSGSGRPLQPASESASARRPATQRATPANAGVDRYDSRTTLMAMMEADPELRFEDILRCEHCGTLFTDRVPAVPALNRFYAAYYANDGYLRKVDRKLALEQRRIFIMKWLVSGRRFLDVGCNIGCAVEAARRNGFTATGIDLTPYALRIARERFPKNRFLEGTIDALEAGTVFDLVYCT